MPCAADGIKHHIHPIASQIADALNEVLGAVVDRCCSECGHEFVVVLGGRAVHLRPSQLAEIEKSGPYASGRTLNQDAFAAPDAGGFVQRQVRGEVVHYQADGLGGIKARRDGHQLAGWPADELRVAAALKSRKTRDHLPRFDGRHPLAKLVYDANDVHP